jgi:hypothetical protein
VAKETAMRTLAVLTLLTLGGAAAADEKKLEGAWAKKVQDFEIKVAFPKADALVFTMGNGNDSCKLEAGYKREKDGTLKCKVTKYEKNGNFPDIKEGFEFSFKFEPKGKKGTLSDLKAENVADEAKGAVEGEYDKAD